MQREANVAGVGVDVHYKFSQVTMRDAAGHVVGRERLDHLDRAGAIFSRRAGLRVPGPAPADPDDALEDRSGGPARWGAAAWAHGSNRPRHCPGVSAPFHPARQPPPRLCLLRPEGAARQ